ncbi:hypothetical protein AMTR_s00152p00083120 [Amborella trichopoda]|uniref:Uncharacterized protein n=1 Tax=Amborella trichopoda TaxID=13333 RepID=W1PL53_AMBTC|nr:hypothetical protein AMTR_s00152p00083120 [Amborella trichopoda]
MQKAGEHKIIVSSGTSKTHTLSVDNHTNGPSMAHHAYKSRTIPQTLTKGNLNQPNKGGRVGGSMGSHDVAKRSHAHPWMGSHANTRDGLQPSPRAIKSFGRSPMILRQVHFQVFGLQPSLSAIKSFGRSPMILRQAHFQAKDLPKNNSNLVVSRCKNPDTSTFISNPYEPWLTPSQVHMNPKDTPSQVYMNPGTTHSQVFMNPEATPLKSL